ncbi:MAG: nitrous oxide reductase accessory protein NosL [Reichenbachiella sp.]
MKINATMGFAFPLVTKYRLAKIFLVVQMLPFVSCSIEPAVINYGSDQCHFCKMTIVDQQHAAQFVTNKGKAHKFDAIECMMKELKVRNESDIKFILISDYETPKKLVDAQSAYYLVSEKIPSPMGAYLSGFANQETRDWMQKENDGSVYDWIQLKKEFSK